MPYYFEDSNGKHEITIGELFHITSPSSTKLHWKFHVEGDDRHEGDLYDIEHHGDLFETFSFRVSKIEGDKPIIFDITTKPEGLHAGDHEFVIMSGHVGICTIKVNAKKRVETIIDSPPETPRRTDPPRREEPTRPSDNNVQPTKHPEPSIWAMFGVRSLYWLVIVVILFVISCGGFSVWTGGKVVNLAIDWARLGLEKPETPSVAPAAAPQTTVTPTLESRPPVQATPPPPTEEESSNKDDNKDKNPPKKK